MLPHRKIIAWILMFMVAFVAYFGFSAVTDAVVVDGASVFLVPAIWFLVTISLFSVGALLWQERMYKGVASVVVILPSLFFAPTLSHLGILLIAGLCVFGGLLHVGREISERIHLSLYRCVRVGLGSIIFALSIVISSQYYVHISPLTWEQLVPSFDLAQGSGAWLFRLAGTVSPSLATVQDRNLSVDTFLRELRPTVEVGGPGETLSNGIDEAVRQAEIVRSKIELSRLLGRSVSGDESMNAILSEVLRKKVTTFITGGVSEKTSKVPFFPYFLAILLFFTIYPIGSLLALPALALATIIFTLLVRNSLISVKSVSIEQEVIV